MTTKQNPIRDMLYVVCFKQSGSSNLRSYLKKAGFCECHFLSLQIWYKQHIVVSSDSNKLKKKLFFAQKLIIKKLVSSLFLSLTSTHHLYICSMTFANYICWNSSTYVGGNGIGIGPAAIYWGGANRKLGQASKNQTCGNFEQKKSYIFAFFVSSVNITKMTCIGMVK